MYTPRQYATQAEELKAKAKGLEVPVLNTLINVLRRTGKIDAAVAELEKLGPRDSKLRSTRKFRLAAEAIRAKQKLDSKTLEMF